MVFFLAYDVYHLRGLPLGDALQRDGHLLLKPCFDVRRGVLAKLDCLLLPGSMHPVVCLNDVRASLKGFLAESAHPLAAPSHAGWAAGYGGLGQPTGNGGHLYCAVLGPSAE